MTTRIRSSCSRLVLLTLLTLLTWLTAFAEGAPAPYAHPLLRQPTPSDRSLHIRSIPAINGLTSNVYEVLMQPYNFEVPALTAVAELMAAGAEAGTEGGGGTLMLSQPHPPVGPLLVTGNLSGLPASSRLALQVRRWGDLRAGCDAAALGPHFDPYMMHVSSPGVLPAPRAPGEVGVVQSGEDGTARVHLMSGALALAGPHSVLGRALVLRALPDTAASPAPAPAADEGKAVACGVIALARYQPPPMPPPPPMRPAMMPGAAGVGAPVDGVELLDRP